jgi:hypothetical protein
VRSCGAEAGKQRSGAERERSSPVHRFFFLFLFAGTAHRRLIRERFVVADHGPLPPPPLHRLASTSSLVSGVACVFAAMEQI